MSAPDAMSGHMPTLRALAESCDVCVEFGVRRPNATIALLAGCRGKVYSYDLERYPPAEKLYKTIQSAVGDRWVFTLGDSAKVEIPECDLMLHDSLHNYDHVSAELKAHAHKVRKYMAFHDTDTLGKHGQRTWDSPNPDPDIKGIIPAVMDYVDEHDDSWRVKFLHTHSNGMLVMERQS